MRKSSQVCTSGENLQLLQQKEKEKEKARLKELKKIPRKKGSSYRLINGVVV